MANTGILTVPVSDRDHIQGKDGAPVTLLQYGDYECPYCGQAYYIVKQLLADMHSTIQFVFRNFPLTQIHPHALSAALAAEASGKQHRYFEMHDLLYEHQDTLEAEHLIAFAQVLGLDIEQYILDMTSDDLALRVREDFIGGIRSGVNGTPTFYINTVRHDDSYDYQTLRAALEATAEAPIEGPGANQAKVLGPKKARS
jgi:protein-disulfide isomerase